MAAGGWGREPIQHTPWGTQGVATGIKYSKGLSPSGECWHTGIKGRASTRWLYSAGPLPTLRFDVRSLGYTSVEKKKATIIMAIEKPNHLKGGEAAWNCIT